MTSQNAIITRPEHDKITKYLSEWNKEVITEAKKKGILMKDLAADKANRTEFEKFLTKQNPSFVFLNGHGDAETVKGHKDEPLVKCGDNEEVLKDKVVYALSCDSASKLGASAIKKGTKAYIGYTEPFSFLTNKNKECRPKDDELANVFKEASNQVALALLNGKTAEDAYNVSQLKFKELMQKFSASNAPLEAEEIRFWLFWDMQAQAVLTR
ncbi:hypothetical protein HY489_05660 [Candidatus Woesearchaeota archaeon]|nr:hypothetical protein [Candidatus Woesearchaeota archaeon]